MKLLLLTALISLSLQANAACKIINSKGGVVTSLADAVFNLVTSQNQCPQDIFAFKVAVVVDGLSTRNAMVANRGHHNPRFGSFSFFETAEGLSKSSQRSVTRDEFFFGHFTKAQQGQVVLDQEGRLMIELIAWDPQKGMYNFYELIRGRNANTWFYRGDSQDALLDNQNLHLQANPKHPQFGQRMRCSGCHTSGGPIMKELEPPHNAWWKTTRPLPLAPNQTSQQLEEWLDETTDATNFAKDVASGISKLEKSENYQKAKASLSFQEQLRPLFCTTEINLISDQNPLESSSSTLQIATDFWVNPILVSQSPIQLSKAMYIEALVKKGFQFPETQRLDADHGWLTPVKGHSDITAIQSLIKKGWVGSEFVADVLAVDFKNPLFSPQRCSLLKALPPQPHANWMATFQRNLVNSGTAAAQELLEHLIDPMKTKKHHATKAAQFLTQTQTRVHSKAGVQAEITRLQKSRQAVFENEISKNPLGQIFEPGFRVIFPQGSL